MGTLVEPGIVAGDVVNFAECLTSAVVDEVEAAMGAVAAVVKIEFVYVVTVFAPVFVVMVLDEIVFVGVVTVYDDVVVTVLQFLS